jgi:adenylate cyclase
MHWLGRHRLFILAAICGSLTAFVFLARLLTEVPFVSAVWTFEQKFEDFLQKEGRRTATRDDFVFLGIDQSTLQMPPLAPEELANNRAFQLMTERPYPWSREVWALLLDRLFGAGAKLVMFDLLFSSPNDGDPAFRAALDRYRDRVVIGANFDFSAVRGEGGAAQMVPPNESLIPVPQIEDIRVGFVNFFPDPLDQKVRAARYSVTDLQLAGYAPGPGERPYTAFSARGLEKIGHAKDIPRDLQSHPMRFSASDAYPPRPLYEVFDPKFWGQNYGNGAFFIDKIIIIGASSQVAHDVVATPVDAEMPGPALHLQAMAATIDHEFLRSTSLSTAYMLVGGAGLLAWLLIAFIRRPLLSLLLLIGVSAAYLGLARILYDSSGLLLLTVPVLAAFLFSGFFSLGFEYVLESLEKMRTRRTLERYVSKNLVKEILDNPESFYDTLKGVRKPATMLFSDIIGFTTLTENADPEKLVVQLNEYLTRMVAVVFEQDGTLDKFIGDAVMAVWGMARSAGVENDAKMAARAALGMRHELKLLNDRWKTEGSQPLGIGIGINQGDVLAGNIGSSERADLTVIGDAVNLASRLEGLTRTYGVDILLGANATELVRDEFHVRSVALVQVKGKTKPVEISALLGARDESFDQEFLKWLESYEEAMQKFRARDFTGAKILLSRFLESYPRDGLAHLYLARASEYETQPPDEGWNAVEVFQKK